MGQRLLTTHTGSSRLCAHTRYAYFVKLAFHEICKSTAKFAKWVRLGLWSR